MKTAETPKSMQSHEKDYREHAWDEYSIEELGEWVHLLAKRSTHREDAAKRAKDLYDAQNYLNAMQSKLDALK